MKVFINDGEGNYTEMANALGATDVRAGKGLLVFDYDNDGDQDMFITNNGEHPVLYRNDGGNANNWLRIATEGTVSNRDGIGAFITVIPDLNDPDEFVVTEIDGGNNFMGQNERTAHIGLGDHATVDLVRIEWPSGIVQTFENVNANSLLSALETVSADFNGDLALDCADADALVAAIAAGLNAAAFDLDSYGVVDAADLTAWLSAAGEANLGPGLAYLVGDANLDGTVDGADFLAWNGSKFTSGAGWCGGDFTGDGTTDGADFVAWNQNKFTSSDHFMVPEPAVSWLMVLATASLIPRRRK